MALAGVLCALVVPIQVASAAGLTDVHSLAAFRKAFNGDAGRPRLILLLSPT